MARYLVQSYDEANGRCDILDNESGKNFRARCEPTGRTRQNEKTKNQRKGVKDMQTRTYANAGEEVHTKAERYADKMGCSYADGLRHVARSKPQLWRSYMHGEATAEKNLSDAVDKGIKVYLATHPGVSYREALRALVEEGAKRKEGAAKEVEFRTRAYQEEWNLTPDEARRRVLQHDPKLARHYDTTASGELADLAKTLMGMAQPELDFKAALLQTARGNPELVRKVAGDELARRAQTLMSKQTLAQGDRGDSNAQMQRALREVGRMPENAAIVAMWSTGVPTVEGLDAIFPQWHLQD